MSIIIVLRVVTVNDKSHNMLCSYSEHLALSPTHPPEVSEGILLQQLFVKSGQITQKCLIMMTLVTMTLENNLNEENQKVFSYKYIMEEIREDSVQSIFSKKLDSYQ